MTFDPSGEIPALRSEIHRARADIKDLEQQVDEVSGLTDRLGRMEEAQSSLMREQQELARRQKATQDAVDSLRESQERFQIVSAAYDELAIADREKQARFGPHEEARTMAASIIDVVASGHINRSTILDVTQRLAIHTPRFWVAHATLAVAAWLDDNAEQ